MSASEHVWVTQVVPEEGLLCTQDLNSTGWVLRQVEQAASVSNQPCTHQLAHQHSQVWCNGLHPALQVVEQLPSVLGQSNHLCHGSCFTSGY